MENGNRIIKKMDLRYDKTNQYLINFLKIFLISFIIIISNVIKTEYNIWGLLLLLFIHAFYPFKNEINILGRKIKTNKAVNNLLFLLIFLIFAIVKYIEYWKQLRIEYVLGFTLFTFIPAIIMLLNNGKKGLSLKYFFYIYYPAQFTILTILYYFHLFP
ncbi:MAG: hypothetical protein IKG14_05335 [Clostridia bacterium]|nr:hypothetical protein [Clostridia bacterium]